MQNSDIVKKRLSQLKKLSQNLKQTTQLKSDLDVTLIKAILSITKTTNINSSPSFSTPGTHSQPNLSIHNNSSSPNMKSATSLLHKFVNKSSIVDQNKNEQYIQPLFQQTQRSMRDQIQSKKTFNKNNSFHTSQSKFDTEEIIHLREDNVKMQMQIRELKEKLAEYKNKQEQERHQKIREKQKRQDYSDDEGVGHSPYFRLNEQIQLFLTQITVNKSDYKKIQHNAYPIKLTLDKLTIKKQKKSNSASKSKLIEQQFNFIQLEIAKITDVVYIQNNRMLLVFKNQVTNQQAYQYLFLQFDTPETLHRWDLAIYINYKIVTSLNLEKIFMLQFPPKPKIEQKIENTQQTQKIQNKQQKQKDPQIETLRYSQPDIFTQNYKEQQKEFLKLYLQNKRKYVQSQKNLKQEMLQKINQIKNQSQDQFRPLSFNTRNSKEAIQIKLEQPFANIIKQNSLISTQKQKEKHRSQLKIEPIEQKHVKQDENAKIPQKTELNRISEKQQKSEIQPEMIVKQLQSMLISKQKQEQNKKKAQQKKRVNDATNLLKSGRLMMKYSKSAFNPHQKRVFVSQDNTRLCWQDKDSNEFKFIYISDIQSINKGELGPGLQKHLQGKKVSNPNCYVTIHTKVKDRKTLEFGIKSFALMEQFIDCLLILITELRKGRL